MSSSSESEETTSSRGRTKKLKLNEGNAKDKKNGKKTEKPTEMDTDFEVPRKTSKLGALLKASPVKINNSYMPLNQLNTNEEAARGSAQFSRPKRPPPIVINGKPQNHAEFCREINQHIKKGFSLKYAPKSVLLYISDFEEHKKYKTKLSNVDNVEFHTYTAKMDKTHAFVLRGLDGATDTQEIKEELEEMGTPVKSVFRMKTKNNNLFLVITDNTVTLNKLNNEIRALNYTRIQWERRYNERRISQCRRCQMWGHATSNCFRAPKCVKCAGSHLSHVCEKPISDKPTCANCGGDHTAANVACPVYKAKLAKLEVEATTKSPQVQSQVPSNPRTTRYIPAPQPSENAWTKRTQQTHTQNTNIVNTPQTNTTIPKNTAIGSDAPTTDFQCLMQELESLNKKVNLREAIRAISRLNEMLSQSKNAMETIMILQDFSKNELNKFNISGC